MGNKKKAQFPYMVFNSSPACKTQFLGGGAVSASQDLPPGANCTQPGLAQKSSGSAFKNPASGLAARPVHQSNPPSRGRDGAGLPPRGGRGGGNAKEGHGALGWLEAGADGKCGIGGPAQHASDRLLDPSVRARTGSEWSRAERGGA